ncbi:MAG: 3'(2'),5'-bisphosphate nucleotidase CysQ [Symbiobacteriia bacterium]
MRPHQREVDVLHEAIRTAGSVLMRAVEDGFTTAHKDNHDPVTSADLEANQVLKELLLGSFPDDGWLSEETRDSAARLGRNRVWIVDPIDGTKEFVSRIPQFAVSVALVEEGVPVVGAVYNPLSAELFTAVRGEGARLNGHPVKADHPMGERLVVLASRSEVKRGEFKTFDASAEITPVGSIAYKLALVAAGRGDATWSLGPKNEWDIAAGVLLVQEAGGSVTDKAGRAFRFNQPNTLVNGIVATSAGAHDKVLQLLREHAPRA